MDAEKYFLNFCKETIWGKQFNRCDNNSNKKASIRWQDSAPPISGYWPTSEPNTG